MPGESFENRESPDEAIEAQLLNLARTIEARSRTNEVVEAVYEERILELSDQSQIIIKTIYTKGNLKSQQEAQERIIAVQNRILKNQTKYPYKEIIAHAKRDRKVSLVEDTQVQGRFFLVTNRGNIEYFP